MEQKEVNKKSLIFGLSLIATICIIGVYRSQKVKIDGIYTIATIYNITGARGGLKIYYEYYYRGNRYESYAIGSEYTFEDKSKRYFLQFLEENPSRCIIRDIHVPDSITEAPYEGWKELPVPVQE